jgi:shikimate 5-dehydrogenase
MLARDILAAMHLVAVVGGDQDLAHRLRGFRDAGQRFLLHPIAPRPLPALTDALRTLDFAGAVVLDERSQRDAGASAERGSLDVRELRAADALVITPAGVVTDLHLGRAIGAALRQRLWDPRGARAVVQGSDLHARAAARELASLGVAHLCVIASDRPEAERVTGLLAAATSTAALAEAEPAAQAMLERADLVVRSSEAATLPAHVLGPHLALVDLVPGALSAWRRRGLEVGALTIGALDVEAHRLQLALTSILGPGVALEPLMALVHDA